MEKKFETEITIKLANMGEDFKITIDDELIPILMGVTGGVPAGKGEMDVYIITRCAEFDYVAMEFCSDHFVESLRRRFVVESPDVFGLAIALNHINVNPEGLGPWMDFNGVVSLPTFGAEPDDTEGLYSWDDDGNVLWYDVEWRATNLKDVCYER
jgi:hypothetical protein